MTNNKQTNRSSRKTSASTRPPESITTRIVRDSRWVHRNQIELGMYVAELDRPWSETRFMFQGFVIDSRELLDQVQESCEYALVESEKLARISSNSTYRLVGEHRISA